MESLSGIWSGMKSDLELLVPFLSSVYTLTYWLSVCLPYGDTLHSLTYAGIR